MAKAKKSNLKLIVLCCSALLALVAIILFFAAPAVNLVNSKNEVQASYTGMQVAFGYSTKTTIMGSEIVNKVLDFSFLYFLALILLVAGLVCGCLTLALPKKAKLLKFISCATLVVGGIVLFLGVPATIANAEGAKTVYSWFGATADVEKLRASFRESCNLGVGAIIGGILSILAGLGVVGSEFVK